MRYVPQEIAVTEPNLPIGEMLDCGYIKLLNQDPEKCLDSASVVILANDHSFFIEKWSQLEKIIKPGTMIVDVWNMTKKGKIYWIKDVSK